MIMNIAKLKQLLKDREIRKDIIFVLAMLCVFRILAHIPIPGIDAAQLRTYFAGNQFLGLLNIFTGGGLENFSIVMLGVGPYITSSIIFQLLTMVVPKIEELSKEGERGREKINRYTRYLAVPLALIQGYGTLVLLSSQTGTNILANMNALDKITALVSVTAGTIFLMWIGELISERKVGNGISILIFAGIVSSLPRSIIQAWTDLSTNPGALANYIIFIIITLITIAAIVFITEGERNIPINHARQVQGMRTYGSMRTHLPLRVNQAGMIPIIFAISFLLMPPVLAQFFLGAQSGWVSSSAQTIIALFNNQLFYGILYFVLVVGFTYFYTAIIFQPQQIAENLQKQGAFIPGTRPGKETAQFLNYCMTRVVFAGALFLGFIAVLPLVMQNVGNFNLIIGGSSMLIVVGVVIEIVKQVDSQLLMRHYAL
jgi:preprotein translocase subunit SecY